VFRPVFVFILAFLLTGAVLSAQNPQATAAGATEEKSPAEVSAELDAELAKLMASPWQRTLSLRAATGYRDNLLLSPFAPIGRMFVQAEVEGFAWRLPMQHWEFVAFLNGDVIRYISPPAETSGEQQWFGHGEVRWLPSDAWRLTLAGQVYYQDLVMDLSDTAATRQIVATRTRGALVTAASQVNLFGGFAFAPSVQVHRSTYRKFPGDYDEVKSGARLEWKHGQGLVISAAWFEHARGYDERPKFTAGGRELTGTHLHFRQHEGELKAADSWTAHGHWTASAALSRLENRDGGSGFFDYREKRVRLEVAWERGPWRLSFDGDAKRRDYLVQTVGIGIAPPPRITDEYDVSGRVERQAGKVWSIYAEEQWERSRSNESDFNYRANTSILGVQRVY